MDKHEQLRKAIRIVGGHREFVEELNRATGLKIKLSATKYWLLRGIPEPFWVKVVPAIEKLSEGTVRAEDLVPEVIWNRNRAGKLVSFTTML